MTVDVSLSQQIHAMGSLNLLLVCKNRFRPTWHGDVQQPRTTKRSRGVGPCLP